MEIYTCNICHFIFRYDGMPKCCPDCYGETTIGHSDNRMKFSIPAVREATAAEISEYERAEKTISEKQNYFDRIRNLKNYKLTDDEYHTALMLIFYFRTMPGEYTSSQLDILLLSRNSIIERKIAESNARDLYLNMQKHFISEIGNERRKTGCNDAVEVASYAGKDSAAELLIQFRQSVDDQITGKTQNLANIRKVRYDEIVKEPSKEYLRFLMDWHNTL